jgi:ABC-type transport system involved in multi-copper enzyme maturation permease subunit
MKMPNALSPIIKIAKYTLTDEVRQKSFIIMFVICAIFIFLVRGCYQGNYMVNGQELDAGTIIRVVSKVVFHIIAAGVMLLTALLSMRVIKRDRDDGMQACILSKPIARWQYVAGKILGLWALSVAFMFILHGIVFVLTSINLNVVMPEYLVASLICSFNLLFVIIAVLLLSLLMPDIVAFLCAMGIGGVSFVADGIFCIWPKLSGTQQFASSFIVSEVFHEFWSIYPLINVLVYCIILGALLFRRFRREDII